MQVTGAAIMLRYCISISMRRTIALLHSLISSQQKGARSYTVTQAMSMKDLPPELTAQVISYLALLETPNTEPPYVNSKPHISQYACVSSSLQFAIERCLFSYLALKSDDLSTFEALVAHSTRRRALLQGLSFKPVLPAYDIHACARFEKLYDQQANNEAFATAVKSLYTILHACDAVEGEKPLEIHLDTPFAPSDMSHTEWDEIQSRWRCWDYDDRQEVWSRRYAQSYLRLDEQTDLAASNRITTFSISADGPRYVAPASVCALLKCHNKLESLSLDLQDNERKSPDLRVQLRIEFARCLRDIRCSTLTYLNLSYRYEEPCDQRFVNADVRDIHKGSTHDALSTSLHNLIVRCPKLKTIKLDGSICIDESFFWPQNLILGADEPRWPDLQEFWVHLSPVRPDGGWWLDNHSGMPIEEPTAVDDRRPDSSDDSDSDDQPDSSRFPDDSPRPDRYDAYREGLQTGDAYYCAFRTQPTESLERLLVAAARAATNMPNLRTMSVTIPVACCPRTGQIELSMTYEAKGTPHWRTKVPSSCDTLGWCVPSDWEMNENLEKLWRTVIGPEGEFTYHRW
jgi:hypothetical protein